MSRGQAAGGAAGSRRATAFVAVGAVLVCLVGALCVLSLFWTPYDPSAMAPAMRFAGPGAAHPLGCDQFGRDVLSRVMASSRPALAVGAGSVLLGGAAGAALGAVAACSSALRTIAMRLTDAMMAFPGILLAMVLVLVMGRGLPSTFLAVAVFMVPGFARLTCSLVAQELQGAYVRSARSYGCGTARVLAVHVAPNIAPRLVTQLTSMVGTAMLLEASLSFLGMGVQPPQTSWGLMVGEALQYVLTYPWQPAAPGAALTLAVLGFNLLGDGLNDLLVERGA